jgi:hypothetical protein
VLQVREGGSCLLVCIKGACSRPSAASRQPWLKINTPNTRASKPPTPRWSIFVPPDSLDGVTRSCDNNLHSVPRALASRGLDPATPLYVSADWSASDPSTVESVMGALVDAGYRVVKAPRDLGQLGAETWALVDYEIAMKADRFLGNPLAPQSALAIMQRRRAGLWAGQYNPGETPLMALVPLFKLPWVFTFNARSPDYEPLLKAAVASAAKRRGLAPHCLYAGDPAAPIAVWLRDQGVRLLEHAPKWEKRLSEKLKGRAPHPTFQHDAEIMSAWQRLDIPLAPKLEQYSYVLYTDVDVLFRRDINLHDFPNPLPKSVGLGPEITSLMPYNVGVMLMHLPALRSSYEKFLEFILDDGSQVSTNQVGGRAGLQCKFSRLTQNPAGIQHKHLSSLPTNPPPPRPPTTNSTRTTSTGGASPQNSTPSPTTSTRPATSARSPSSTSTGPSRWTTCSCRSGAAPPPTRPCARAGWRGARAVTWRSGSGIRQAARRRRGS